MTSADLVDRLAQFLGYPQSLTSDQKAFLLVRLNDGYRRVLRGAYTHPATKRTETRAWGFLKPQRTIVLWPDIDGTVTATGEVPKGSTNTLITATTAAFYPSMVGRTVTIADTGSYTVASYVSSTQITISGSHTFSGKAISIASGGRFGLDDDFAGLCDRLVFDYSAEVIRPEFKEQSAYQIENLRRNDITAGIPNYYCVITRTSETGVKQAYDLFVYKTPDKVYNVIARFEVAVSALTYSTSEYPVGGMNMCDVYLQAGKAEVERLKGYVVGPEESRLQTLMYEAAKVDADRLDDTNFQGNLMDVPNGMT